MISFCQLSIKGARWIYILFTADSTNALKTISHFIHETRKANLYREGLQRALLDLHSTEQSVGNSREPQAYTHYQESRFLNKKQRSFIHSFLSFMKFQQMTRWQKWNNWREDNFLWSCFFNDFKSFSARKGIRPDAVFTTTQEWFETNKSFGNCSLIICSLFLTDNDDIKSLLRSWEWISRQKLFVCSITTDPIRWNGKEFLKIFSSSRTDIRL